MMKAALKTANVEDLCQVIRRQSKPCVFFLGAGCSVTAGIPLARDIVAYARVNYASLQAGGNRRTGRPPTRVAIPDYPALMHRLKGHARYWMFHRLVSVSSLNWSHVALAHLMRVGYVGRVLTTNFDDLVVRASALFGIHPGAHDLGSLHRLVKRMESPDSLYRESLVREPVVFYLHGRHNGFFQVHSGGQAQKQAEALKPVLDQILSRIRDRLWIVVGYSGQSDPLFGTFKRAARSKVGFYWVNRTKPHGEVRRALVSGTKARFIEATADRFFLDLVRGLEGPNGVACSEVFGRRVLSETAALLHALPPPDRGRVPRVPGLRSVRRNVELVDRCSAAEARLARRLKEARKCLKSHRFGEIIRSLQGDEKAKQSAAVTLVARARVHRGEERLQKLQMATAKDDFLRADQLLDPSLVLRDWHKCLQDYSQEQRLNASTQWKRLFTLYSTVCVAGSVVRSRALEGLANIGLLTTVDRLEKPLSRTQLKAVERKVQAALADDQRNAFLHLARAELLVTRIAAAGARKPVLSRESLRDLGKALRGMSEASAQQLRHANQAMATASRQVHRSKSSHANVVQLLREAAEAARRVVYSMRRLAAE